MILYSPTIPQLSCQPSSFKDISNTSCRPVRELAITPPPNNFSVKWRRKNSEFANVVPFSEWHRFSVEEWATLITLVGFGSDYGVRLIDLRKYLSNYGRHGNRNSRGTLPVYSLKYVQATDKRSRDDHAIPMASSASEESGSLTTP